MSNSKQKKEDDNETSWGAIFGIAAGIGAVALAGGAAYAISKALSSDDEKPPSKSFKTELPSVSKTSHYQLADAPYDSSHSTGSDLQNKLETYYRHYVEIDDEEMHSARMVVEDIKNEYLAYLRQNMPGIKVRMVDSGSSSEGLKVIEPDEFDVMLVVEGRDILKDNDLCITPSPNKYFYDAGGFYFLCIESKSQENQAVTGKSRWPNALKWIEDGYLSPGKARSAFQSLSAQVFNRSSLFSNTRASVGGPAVTVTVKHQNREISIDFVPAYDISGEIYVAKPHPNLFQPGGCDEKYKYLWRRSFSQEEKVHVEKLSHYGCQLKCLKIMKAIQVRHSPQLGMFPSYILKTLLFHLYKRDPWWPEEELEDKFLHFLENLQRCLEQKRLYNFFQQDINLLQNMTDKQCEQAVNYLKRTITKSRWNSLLEI